MKYSLEEIAAVTKVYETYFDSYLKGDTQTIASLLDDDYTQIGSAEAEVFFNKKEAVQFIVDTIDQVAGKAEMRNRILKPIQLESGILFNDLFDMYVLIEGEWNFYAKFRASTLMQKKAGGWKFMHQHSSMPDTKAAEGENIAIEKISAENQQLRDAIKRRTVELDQKNRELEIEASLERIRAASMAMQHSSGLLVVIKVITDQLQLLGFRFEGATFQKYQEDFSWDAWFSTQTELIPFSIHIPPGNHKVQKLYEEARKNNLDFYTYDLNVDESNKFFKHFFNTASPGDIFSDQRQQEVFTSHGLVASVNVYPQVVLSMYKFDAIPYTDQENVVFKRIGNVFEQSYTRFLDLQKAEAQTREVQIELGLERVRARAMAMHHSTELAELVDTVFKELTKLHISLNRCQIMIMGPGEKTLRTWMANPEIDKTPNSYLLTLANYPYLQAIVEAWKEKKSKWTYQLTGAEKDALVKYVFSETDFRLLPEMVKTGMIGTDNIYFSSSYNNFGSLQVDTLEPLSDENLDIIYRFGKVFDLTYTRFNDLQKAETQTREAQIELGLERVRARAMAMQHSDELAALVQTMFIELTKLQIQPDRCIIMIFDQHSLSSTWWMANSEPGSDPVGVFIKYHDYPPYLAYLDAWKNKQVKWEYLLEGNEKKEWDEFIFTQTDLSTLPQVVQDGMRGNPKIFLNGSNNNFGSLTLATIDPLKDENFDILLRFAKVFDLTYTRFNDLQKAEAQARESQIEAALEKVRSRSLAMHHSDELKEVIGEVLRKLEELGIAMENRSAIICLYKEGAKEFEQWVASPEHSSAHGVQTTYFDSEIHNDIWNARNNGTDFYAKSYSVEEKNAMFQHFFAHTDLSLMPEQEKNWLIEREYYELAIALEKHSAVLIANFTADLLHLHVRQILKRFAKVFEQAYIRFLDLQKSEAQTREAEIQLALERVRARTMAMQRSEELAEACELLFEEFRKLRIVKAEQEGTAGDRTTIGIFNEAEDTYDLSVTSLDGEKLDHTFHLRMDEPVNIAKVYTAWKEGKPLLVIDMHGEDLNRWFHYLETLGLPINPDLYNKRRVNTFAFFSKGNLGISTNEPLSEESLHLLQRFADTFNLTYTRFQDLKDAEARTQVAVKEASLDRVRGEIASMRTAEDLQHITPLVWRELTALGVPFFRCGVFIVDDEKQLIHFYLSSPDGKPLAALELDFNISEVTKNATDSWRQQQVYISHWRKEEFLEFANILISLGQVQNINNYQGGEAAPESLTLQFVPFAQGMMYVGSGEELSTQQIYLVQSLADAFSTAYSRYEDFNKLELAKQQIEKTLVDLKQAQVQLIQSEKMASLGELTAGIAHEIQNPLNFVNNFSEVSTELVDEMNEELNKGNIEIAKEIANDLIQNLEKINHHGKRAGDIVKGMLQHSRSSTGITEPTDINALADEYLRLAYHGLRAKDKSFNATLITDFDETLGKINIISQDIGRVILNLITNAFYAVSEKKKQSLEGYEPTVTVSTQLASSSNNPQMRQSANSLIISVKDNGNGIPQNIVDKIFQPFFTTKPTGQGTGLGLSLSYDIVKAHGGEIRVETPNEGGTNFHILLPLNQ